VIDILLLYRLAVAAAAMNQTVEHECGSLIINVDLLHATLSRQVLGSCETPPVQQIDPSAERFERVTLL